MGNEKNSDLVMASVRKSIALEMFGGYLFLSAIVIAIALASGLAQLLLGVFLIVIISAFGRSKSHHNEKSHYGLYSADDTPKSSGKS